MLSVSVIGAGSKAAGYANYQESEVAAAREDYYSAEGDAGRWTGKAAEEMRLVGDLKPGELLLGLQGFHPAGLALAKNAGEKHKGGWDLTFSAPKSVSCIWSVIDPETRAAIESAQNASAARALEFLEDSGAFLSRSRNESAPVEGVAAAMYLHGTSREADPQLHTHVAVLNVQPDGTAMDFDTRWKMAAGAVYRAELAAAMQKLGFQIEADGKSFCIAGVSEAVEKEFSTRRQQIKAIMAAGCGAQFKTHGLEQLHQQFAVRLLVVNHQQLAARACVAARLPPCWQDRCALGSSAMHLRQEQPYAE